MNNSVRCILLAGAAACGAQAWQSAYGMASGIVHLPDGTPAKGAPVVFRHLDTGQEFRASTGEGGVYAILFLPPGNYHARAEDPHRRYIPDDIAELELPVAARLAVDFNLRARTGLRGPVVTGGGALIRYFGHDAAETLSDQMRLFLPESASTGASLSAAVQGDALRFIPLSGQDTFTLLVTAPGVTADNATARGLGLSVNGQRPPSANFLLDGAEHDDYLTSGPLSPVPPEAVSDYLFSINNFGAEFGGTSGLLANAVSRAGANQLHGQIFSHVLDARFAASAPLPRTEFRGGFSVAGPVVRSRIFHSMTLESVRSRAASEPVTVAVPRLESFERCQHVSNSARQLLRLYPPPSPGGPVAGDPCDNLRVLIETAPPFTTDRWFGLGRVDVSLRGESRIFFRAASSRLTQPGFIPSVFKDLGTDLGIGSDAIAAGFTGLLPGANAMWLDLRVSARRSRYGWEPPAQGPLLVSSDGTRLPGNQTATTFTGRDTVFEVSPAVIASAGRHIVTFGGGTLVRQPRLQRGYFADGRMEFPSVDGFARLEPSQILASVNKGSRDWTRLPEFGAAYRNYQFHGFVQDSIRLSGRMTVNSGLRYDSFGSLGNIHEPDRNNWAGRAGVSYALSRDGLTRVRAGIGIFHDRPYDNLFSKTLYNGVALVYCFPEGGVADPVGGLRALIQSLAPDACAAPLPAGTLNVARNLRSAYAANGFAGIEHRIRERLTVEASFMGSQARKLILTDRLNRPGSAGYDPDAGEIATRFSGGASRYSGLALGARYRGRKGMIRAAYTLSRSLDSQTDPLAGDYDDLGQVRPGKPVPAFSRAEFATLSRQGDTRADWGRSDFDQTHGLVLHSFWTVQGPARGAARAVFGGWTFSEIAGLRSGFPFSVYSGTYGERAPSGAIRQVRQEIKGAVRLLEFMPAGGAPMERNSLRGPGFWNLDVSAAKTVPIGWREGTALQIRADAFNALNHANLGPPDPYVASDSFGLAVRGRPGYAPAFPALTPLNESARRIQFQLRLLF